MADKGDGLVPPKRSNTGDPGAHDLAESSDSEDHFSDAQSAPSESQRNSPLPRTRVEKVSDEPSYGEVPGTEAYRLREGDAEPDEIAIIPDKTEPGEAPGGEGDDYDDEARSPGGHPVPKTVVEESPDSDGSRTHPEKKHRTDPPPDLVLKADGKVESGESATDTPISPALKTPNTARSRRSPASFASPSPFSAGAGDDADDDFGDDFDDFEEGAEDEDFGEFDDGPAEAAVPRPTTATPVATATATATAPPPSQPPPLQTLPFAVPDFEGLEPDEILSVTGPYLSALLPHDDDDLPSLPPLPKDSPVFLTPRSASLWSQLVAPPPLQPPDWIRSRIRRLFLVSLGVPVDLDEILPASKQKKLVLPSLSRRGSPRTSTDSRPPNNLARLRRLSDANASSTSLDSQGRTKEPSGGGRKNNGSSSSRKRGGEPAGPQLDLVAARQLCTTTDEALDGMTEAELQAHIRKLVAMQDTTTAVLEYWKKRTDEKIGDREAFEGVIENLVKHARKVRK